MKKIFLAFMVCAGLNFSSCALDEYNPLEITGDEILSTYSGFYGMQGRIYEPLYKQLYTVYDFISMAEGGTDIWWTQPSWMDYAPELIYYEGLSSSTNGTNKAFKQMYAALSICNAIISRAGGLQDGSPENIATLVAEAKFMRGFYHLLLTTYYGPITLVLHEPKDGIELYPHRNTLSEIYNAVISDFTDAIDGLKETPFEGNRARATKAAARGMLARAYTQGAGQGLTENGVSYWQRAKEVAEDMIRDYGTSRMYDDVEDVWAHANNLDNKEALFVAASPSSNFTSSEWSAAGGGNYNLLKYFLTDNSKLNSILIKSSNNLYVYGRCQETSPGASKYLIDCFNPLWDKRWENSFITQYGVSSNLGWPDGWGGNLYPNTVVITQETVDTYGIDPSMVGKQVKPYTDVSNCQTVGINNYPSKVWPKEVVKQQMGDENIQQGTPEAEALRENLLPISAVKNLNVTDWPLAVDEERFFLYFVHPKEQPFDRTGRKYLCVEIDKNYVNNERYARNASEVGLPDNNVTWQLIPGFGKFVVNGNDENGGPGYFSKSNMQGRESDIFILRMAEIYLIAAEANVMLGDGGKAAGYLNTLRERAVRDSYTGSDWRLGSATMEDVYDEYARELCGEYSRWALLQRHQAFDTRLPLYNTRAAQNFKPYHKWRPISQNFLDQIENADEYGDNGYKLNSGLDGFEK